MAVRFCLSHEFRADRPSPSFPDLDHRRLAEDFGGQGSEDACRQVAASPDPQRDHLGVGFGCKILSLKVRNTRK